MPSVYLTGMIEHSKRLSLDSGSTSRWTPVGGWLMLLLVVQTVRGESLNTGKDGRNPTVRNVTEDSPCSSKPDGLYPDTVQACRMFFVCSGGKRLATFWCVRGYVFSATTGRCEPPDRAVCRTEVSSSPVSQDCPAGDGVFPDFNNKCSSFHVCKGGRKVTFLCPPSTAFDWRTKSCRHESTVPCQRLSCLEKEDGRYPDVENGCKRYIDCKRNSSTEMLCPEGESFNTRTGMCSSTNLTSCPIPEKHKCLGLPDGFYPNHANDCKSFHLCLNSQAKAFSCPPNTTFSSMSITCEATAECFPPKPDLCHGKANGVYPLHSSDCRDFYVCLDGTLVEAGTCPLGKVLDTETGECQSTSLTLCGKTTDSDCDRKSDGVYPDYDSGCSAYYLCLNHKKVVKNYCSDNRLFDIATETCLPSTLVTCRNSSKQPFTPRLLHSYDCSNRIGIFPEFSQSCRRFVVCANNHETLFQCADGKAFDVDTMSCQRKELTNCLSPSVVSVFQCLPSDQGIYAEFSRNHWYECKRGVGFVIECPRGQYYDPVANVCSHPRTGNTTGSSDRIYVTKPAQELLRVNIFEDENLIFDCANKPNGLYRSSNCGVFHVCAEGSLSSFYCPYEMVFDLESRQCRNPGNESSCETSVQTSRKDTSFDCDKVPDGMYADYEADCHRYFVCESGNSILVYCPDGQRFSSAKMICDDGKKVPCLPPQQQPVNRSTSHINLKDLIYHIDGVEQHPTHETVLAVQVNQQNTDIRTSGASTADSQSNSTNNGSSTVHRRRQPDTKARSYQTTGNRLNTTASRSAAGKRTTTHNRSVNNVTATSTESTHGITVYINRLPSPPTTTTSPKATSSWSSPCPNGDTGFFPDYQSNCKNFHICFRTIRKTYSCPSVLLFNPYSKNCDLPENVVCKSPTPMRAQEFDCSKMSNEFEPDYSSGCQHFIGCSGGMPYKYQCPPGKLFNAQSKTCDSASAVRCNHTGSPLKSLSESAGIDYQLPITSRKQNSYHRHPDSSRNFFDCSRRMDGFYPDFSRHCHVFYRCVRGKKFSHYCKQGLLFNPKSGICDFEENVVCLNDSESDVSEKS